MYQDFQTHLTSELAAIKEAGLFKNERLIASPQGADIVVNGKHVLNFCANNYLGFALSFCISKYSLLFLTLFSTILEI